MSGEESKLMYLNGKVASLMDQISDLRSKGQLDPSEESQLRDLETEEENLTKEIEEVEAHL